MKFSITGNLVDIRNKKNFGAEIWIEHGKVSSIIPSGLTYPNYIIPGFIDAHVHIESSMLIPSEFARLAVAHGTVATVSDPHEIANVCGMEGIDFMIKNGKTVPFKFFFGAPSCVPATIFETSGAAINAEEVDKLLANDEILYLSEMMNFPGVLHGDEEVIKKLNAAKRYNKPVDGHAPALRGADVQKYIDAGITTDHECFSREEAEEKLKLGMKIIVREGSAAKNFDALISLLDDHADNMMFCSDDKHPDSLAAGHINLLCARAVAKGIDVFKILQAACINPVLHYKLPVGLLAEGDDADFIVLEDLQNFEVLQTYINGLLVADNKKSLIKRTKSNLVNNFSCTKKPPEDFSITASSLNKIRNTNRDHTEIGYKGEYEIMEALDGQLITNRIVVSINEEKGMLQTNTDEDILKIVVVNRYAEAPVSKAFIKNFGLKKGAIASSVAHDSHNIIAVGVDDESICRAVNLVIDYKGGISCVGNEEIILPLPVAGLMSHDDGYKVAEAYTAIDKAAKELGTTLSAPFMTLSFMALLVIPHLKLSDKGLFDGDKFEFIQTNT